MSQLPASIELNQHIIMEGDRTSMAVIFNKLSGKNFENPKTWETQTHAQYLAYMANELHVKEWTGELVRREDGKIVARFDFGSLSQPAAQESRASA